MAVEERRIVIVGKTGSGKSSLANTIFGENFKEEGTFETSNAAVSVTSKCELGTKEINGKVIKLIDTPGYFDTNQKEKEVKAENLESLKEGGPGPHAFLLVLKVERYTEQEEEVVNKMLKFFSEKAFKYTTVVFTHGDQIGEGRNIKDWAYKNKALKNLIEKCGGRVHVFDNKYWDNRSRVTELLRTIDQTVEQNGGKYYTNSFWQQLKNMEILGIPGHILFGLMLGAVVLGSAGLGIAGAAGATASTIYIAGISAGLAGGVFGAGAAAFVSDTFVEEIERKTLEAVNDVRSKVKELQIEENKFKLL